MTTKEATPDVNFCSTREKGGEEDERGRKKSPLSAHACMCQEVRETRRGNEKKGICFRTC